LLIGRQNLKLRTDFHEDRVVFDDKLEDLDLALLLERVRHSFVNEVVKFFLVLLSGVGLNEKLLNISHQRDGKVEIVHSCVDSVHLLLKLDIFYVKF
jgi:hypothetical protein